MEIRILEGKWARTRVRQIRCVESLKFCICDVSHPHLGLAC